MVLSSASEVSAVYVMRTVRCRALPPCARTLTVSRRIGRAQIAVIGLGSGFIAEQRSCQGKSDPALQPS